MSRRCRYIVCVRKWKSWYWMDTYSSAEKAMYAQNLYRKHYKVTKIFKEEISV